MHFITTHNRRKRRVKLLNNIPYYCAIQNTIYKLTILSIFTTELKQIENDAQYHIPPIPFQLKDLFSVLFNYLLHREHVFSGSST